MNVFDNNQALKMFKSCNAMRMEAGGVKGPIDGQYIKGLRCFCNVKDWGVIWPPLLTQKPKKLEQ